MIGKELIKKNQEGESEGEIGEGFKRYELPVIK